MNKILRYSFVAFMAMCMGNAFADEFKVTFKDCGGSSDDSKKQTTIEELVAEGGSIFSAVDASEAYQARSGRGVKLGSSKNPGKMVFTLSPTIKISQIKFEARKYNDTELSITVNGKTFTELTGNFDEYTVDLDGSEVAEISISTPEKRAYITTLTIIGEATGNTPDPGTDPEPYTLVGAGTLDNPFTASDAIYLANKGEYASEEVYITGKVFKVNTTDANIEKYGNIDYFISEDGQEANPSFEIFRGKYFNDEAFTLENKVQVGDEVVVKGKLAMYNTQAETAQGAVLIKLNGSTTNISAIKADTQNGAIYNVGGQKVNAGYKGLVIKNGKKFVNK